MGLEHLLSNSRNDQIESFEFRKPRIQVIGCGGAGCNNIHRLMELGIQDVSTIAVNTDKLHLDRVNAEKKLLLGGEVTRGFGTGGDPVIGERIAQLHDKELRNLINGADLTFITVGLGGGSGTGISPYVVRLARDSGSIVVALATMPFKVERGRQKVAIEGLEKLRQASNSLIILDNNRLVEMVPQLPVEQAFAVMDQLISEVIKNVTEMISLPGLINLDFADLKAIFQEGGTSTVLYGENSIYDHHKVVTETLNNPLLDIDCSTAKGALIHLSSGPKLRLGTANQVIEGLTRDLPEKTHVKFGIRFNPNHEGTIRVMCIMTGLEVPAHFRPREDFVKLERDQSSANFGQSSSETYLRR